ncbi:MAG: EAL domain-containing protein, partial [Pseudomonadota bacterium]
MSQADVKLKRNLTGFVAAYIAALSLIAAMVLATHWFASGILSGQTHSAERIDVAGAQRMLSQRMTLLISEIGAPERNDAQTLSALSTARDRFAESHSALRDQNSDLWTGGEISSELAAIYEGPQQIDQLVLSYLAAVDRVLATGAKPEAADLNRISDLAKGPLLAGLDAAVKQMEREVRSSFTFISEVMNWLLAATLLTLLAEGLFIFQPLNRRLRAAAGELMRAHKDLGHSIRHDALTGLPNRRHHREFLDMTLAQATRHGRRVGLCHIDLVGFRRLNETRGEKIGDLVLQRVAGMLRCETRKGDFVARIGADEFAVIASWVMEPEELTTMSARLCKLIGEPFEIDGVKCELDCVSAVVVSEHGEVDHHRLLKDVDITLASAKRDRVKCLEFSTELRETFEAKEQLREELKAALERSEIEPFFQPQICAKSGRIDGFEALARWRHPTRGVLSPFHFLDAISEFGLGDQLDETILEKSLDALISWRNAGLNAPRVGINFSADQLRDPFMAEKIKFAVEQRELEPSDVCIEILETVLVEGEGEQTAQNIAALSSIGFSIDLDDFGTGHASIATLQRFSVDRI